MEENKDKHTRRFSVEDDFMKYDTDDILYGALQHLSTYHPEIHELYLTKKNYSKNRQDLCVLCGLTTRTLKNHLDRLIEKGLVKEKVILSGDQKKEFPSYVFPYNKDGKSHRYQLIDNEMLWYVVSTRNHQAVRLYVKLLNLYNWKKQTNESYIFTVKELMETLGYKTNGGNTLVREMIGNILESFQREGVIDFVDFYEEKINDNGNTIQIPRKKLLFVASTKNEMKSR